MQIITMTTFLRQQIGALSIIAVVLTCVTGAQQPTSKSVCVQSWKKGLAQVKELTLKLEFGAKQLSYESIVPDISGGRHYRLVVRHDPLRQMNREFWGLELYEVKSKSRSASPNENLIAFERPGSGGDNFPREDLIGYLYPEENPNTIRDRRFFYPIMTDRAIRVEGFCLLVHVNSYRLKPADPSKVDSLNVTIEFRNVKSLDDECACTRHPKN